MKTLIKICGIKRLDDLECAIQNGADLIGFVFVKSSPRYIEPSSVTNLLQSVPEKIKTVAVMQHATQNDLARSFCVACCITATVFIFSGTDCNKLVTELGSIYLGEDFTKTNPIKSAPFCMAHSKSSNLLMPHILINVFIYFSDDAAASSEK